MGKSVKPPPAPDYAAAAHSQSLANADAAKWESMYSNPSIRTPYGFSRTDYLPDGRPIIYQGLTPTGEVARTITAPTTNVTPTMQNSPIRLFIASSWWPRLGPDYLRRYFFYNLARL